MIRLQRFYSHLWITVIVGLLAMGGGFVLAQARIAHADQSSNTQAASAQNVSTQSVDIPETFNYQGTLRNTDGTLVNGTVKITANLYDVALGSASHHTETFDNVVVRDGLFNIVLGDDPNPQGDSLSDTMEITPLFIGITVNSDPEIIPRERIHAVPWAVHASDAAHAEDADNATNADHAISAGLADTALHFGGVHVAVFDADASGRDVAINTALPVNDGSHGNTCFLTQQLTQPSFTAHCTITQGSGAGNLQAGPRNICQATCVTWFGQPGN